ncbi:MAG: carboxypeptidase regulatory-like domain-containing protein [candidate division WOR-3 bacterium]
MKRLFVLLPLLVLAVAVSAQTTGISGTVTDAETGLPIVHAKVHTMCGMTYTDSAGHYLLNLRPGAYVVTASAMNYEPAVYPETVVVVHGQVTEHIDFALKPQVGGELGAIAGTVTDMETGKPIPHAKVSTRCACALTDSTGRYTLRGLRPGKYVVVACAQGYEMAVYPDTVVVEPGQTVEGIDFALKPMGGGQCGAIAGKVTDEKTGEIIRGAIVVAKGNGIVRQVTQCCSDYKIGNLPAGRYFVGASAPGYEPGSYPDSVEVVVGQVTEHIDFALVPQGGGQTGGITGTVTDEETGKPLFGACVVAVGQITARANTSLEGVYAIRNLPAGTYSVTAKARGYEPSVPRDVEVVAGQMTEDVDFALKPCTRQKPGAISGVVTDSATGKPIFAACVFAWGPSGQGCARTDSFGGYVLRLKPGPYLVRCHARGHYPAVYPDTVTVVENETVPGINFVLSPGRPQFGGIAGFVYNGYEWGEIYGAKVMAIGPNGSFETFTNEHGEYLFDGLEPGDYRLEVTAQGYAQELYPDLLSVEPDDIASFASPAVYPLTGIEDAAGFNPVTTRRISASPNPVRNTATVRWEVPLAGHVRLSVLDNTGRVVRAIQNGFQSSGQYSATWNGTNDRGEQLPAGVYFYRLETPMCQELEKVVLAR